ncbi:MAG: PEP-CTERM sorting domain-containing protein [Phycisphaerae bacterium]
MSSKTSIVISAADGCGKPSSIRPMDSSHSSNMEQKESFMGTKSFNSGCHYFLLAAIAVAGSIAVVSTVSADVINVQYPAKINNTNATYSVYTGTGAAPDTGTVWNQSNPGTKTATSLVDSQGNPTSVTLENTILANGMRGEPGPAVTNALLDNYLFMDGTTPFTFTIAGLTPGFSYDLYLYSSDGGLANGQGGSFTVNDVSFGQTGSKTQKSTATSTTIPTSDLGITYVEGTTTADTNGDINVSDAPNTVSPTNGADFNGFQLVTPEPATLGLFALGGLGLLLIKRRKNA